MIEKKIRTIYYYENFFIDYYKDLKPDVQKKLFGH